MKYIFMGLLCFSVSFSHTIYVGDFFTMNDSFISAIMFVELRI